jgi:hypothetical protein
MGCQRAAECLMSSSRGLLSVRCDSNVWSRWVHRLAATHRPTRRACGRTSGQCRHAMGGELALMLRWGLREAACMSVCGHHKLARVPSSEHASASPSSAHSDAPQPARQLAHSYASPIYSARSHLNTVIASAEAARMAACSCKQRVGMSMQCTA